MMSLLNWKSMLDWKRINWFWSINQRYFKWILIVWPWKAKGSTQKFLKVKKNTRKYARRIWRFIWEWTFWVFWKKYNLLKAFKSEPSSNYEMLPPKNAFKSINRAKWVRNVLHIQISHIGTNVVFLFIQFPRLNAILERKFPQFEVSSNLDVSNHVIEQKKLIFWSVTWIWIHSVTFVVNAHQSFVLFNWTVPSCSHPLNVFFLVSQAKDLKLRFALIKLSWIFQSLWRWHHQIISGHF